jgi:ribosomal protein S18 acetylase RimI-like enzyme
MLAWLKQQIFPSNDFFVPQDRMDLPSCLVRAFQPDDLARCVEIYGMNEGHYFPKGFSDDFEASLTDPENLVLVIEAGGMVVACGGIHVLADSQHAMLGYGMVHPLYQRGGFGTVLLLSRLAALPRPQVPWEIQMTSAGPSWTFYAQFGFSFKGQFVHANGVRLGYYTARLGASGWNACSLTLGVSGIRRLTTGIGVPKKFALS